jgi:hypothetical protein
MMNTMNDMTMALELGDLGKVNGGVMTETQRNTLISHATVLKRCDRTEEEVIYCLVCMAKYGTSFQGVTEEEITELVHSVYEGA